MTTALVTTQHGQRFSPEQVELIKATICKGASNDELALFMNVCARTGLDPFTKQIYSIRRRSQVDGQWVEKQETQVGIDGFRLVGHRAGLDGMDGPQWCGKDRVWLDVWLEATPPLAARVAVYRRGCSRPFTAVARWVSYAQTTRDGSPAKFWRNMPDLMLGKVAEALALRRAFPAELSGLYIPEEMDQAAVAPAEPAYTPPPAREETPRPAPTQLETTPADKAHPADMAFLATSLEAEFPALDQTAGAKAAARAKRAHWVAETLGRQARPGDLTVGEVQRLLLALDRPVPPQGAQGEAGVL
jgi:phage recombination protein Bet